MERSRILAIVLAVVASTFACAPLPAQQTPLQVPKADQRPMPFPPGSEMSGSAAPLEFRPFDRMTQQDRDLAADAEFAIAERAGFAGLEFNQGKWSYQQIVCSALPGHLFLQFTRNNGTGDVSVFSASIPRGNSGQVHIIPILRRGYSLFSPAPINALTIAAFNHIRAEESPDNPPEWLGTGLCYAALTGAHPQIGPAEESEIGKLPSTPPGTLQIPMHGGAVISFTDVAALPRPMEWTMTFDGKGKLLKAKRSTAPQWKERPVQMTSTEVQGKPVPSTDVDGKAVLIK